MSEWSVVPPKEHGVIRVFAIKLPSDKIDEFGHPNRDATGTICDWPLKEALGASILIEEYVEMFPVADLEGIGIAGYLIEGLGVPAQVIANDRTHLDSIRGHVVIILSEAFGGKPQKLRPKSPLYWIATYEEPQLPVNFEPLPSKSAQRTESREVMGSPPPERSGFGKLAAVVIVAMFALLAFGLIRASGG